MSELTVEVGLSELTVEVGLSERVENVQVERLRDRPLDDLRRLSRELVRLQNRTRPMSHRSTQIQVRYTESDSRPRSRITRCVIRQLGVLATSVRGAKKRTLVRTFQGHQPITEADLH